MRLRPARDEGKLAALRFSDFGEGCVSIARTLVVGPDTDESRRQAPLIGRCEHVCQILDTTVPLGGTPMDAEQEVVGMDVLVERCAGLDVHKKTVMACVRGPGEDGRHQELREFRTFSRDLRRLREWLVAEGVTQVAMEATGVFWKPVWYALEGAGFALPLANARNDAIDGHDQPVEVVR